MADKKSNLAAVLTNWELCNDYLRDASEDEAKALLTLEQSGKRRIQYLLRLHARFNKERAKRERSELLTLRSRS